MGDVVNLNRYRKAQERDRRAREAVENRTRFGRSKSDVARDRADRDRQDQELDGKKRDD